MLHHLTHHSTEWLHLENLRGKAGNIKKAGDTKNAGDTKEEHLRKMLNEFSISRNLAKESGVETLIDYLNGKIFEAPLCFDDIIECSNSCCINTPKDRNFMSGASKVLWFVYGHQYPMYDKWTRKALSATNGDKFKEKLCELKYLDAHKKVKDFFSGRKYDWFSAERFLDKYLFLLGRWKAREVDIFDDHKVKEKYNKLYNNKIVEADRIYKLAKASELEALRCHFDKQKQTKATT